MAKARYRKKPVVIEAEQFFPDRTPWPDGVEERGGEYIVETMEGPLRIRPGDYVVTGVRGEHYPVSKDIFEETYERVDD